MRVPLLALVLGSILLAGLGQVSSVSAATCAGNVRAKTYYYDCATGLYCGETEYYCPFTRPSSSHIGCTTACYENTGSCTCPSPIRETAAAFSPAPENDETPPALCFKAGGEEQPAPRSTP
jgi:hypothetical protein